MPSPYKSSPFAALQFRDFRLLWIGLSISQIGSQMQVVGIAWHIYSLTKSAVYLGLIGLVGFLAVLLFSQIAGIAADTFDRKTLMVVSQCLLFLSAFVLGCATYAHLITPFLIFASIAVSSAVSTFDAPARQALLPNIVPPEHFMNAISLNTTMRKSAVIIGQSLAGFIIALYGVQYIYFFNAVSFIFAIFTILPIADPPQQHEKKGSFSLQAIIEGINFVRTTPIIYTTMLLDFFATFFSSATVLLPIFAQDILHVGPQGLGILYAAESIGGVVSGIGLSALGTIRSQGKVIIGSVIIYGLATIVFGLSRSVILSFLALAILGSGDMVSTIIRNTIRQLMTPDYIRGRMVSVNMIFFMGGPQLGDAEAGFLAAFVGAPASVVVGGLGTILATIIIAHWRPQLRRYTGKELAV